jgi:hypothetical protein
MYCFRKNLDFPFSNQKIITLIISAYLPTRGNYEVDVFMDCIDQLYQIFQKFKDMHDILIGGNLNEDLNKSSPDKRGKYLRTFITDCQLTASFSGNTYINPKGEECTEIDYFLFNSSTFRQFSNKTVLKELNQVVLDHYPISIECNSEFTRRITIECNSEFTRRIIKKDQNINNKIKWEKVDKERYQLLVNQSIVNELKNINLDSNANVENAISKVSNILIADIKQCTPPNPTRNKQRKGKLQVWNSDISNVYKCMCNANEEWYQAGKPRKTDNPIFQNRKEQKMYFRKTYRCEIARREQQLRENIMSTRTRDCKTFHFLI